MAMFVQLPLFVVWLEAYGGAHYWARKLRRLGQEPQLMAPQFVAPYGKNETNVRNDATANCEAVGRPSMRFVPIKEVEQQAVLTLHRTPSLLVAERTALVDHIRGLLSEYRVVVARGVAKVRVALPQISEDGENGLPRLAPEAAMRRADGQDSFHSRPQHDCGD